MANLIKEKHTDRKIINRLFRNVAMVMILSGLAGAITSFTDGICASQLIHNNASAGLQVANPSILFCLVFVTIVEIGTQILCSRALAKGDSQKSNAIFSMSVVLTIVVGLISFFVAFFAAGPIASISGANKDSFDFAVGYLKGFYIGAPFMGLYMMMMPLVSLEGDKRTNYISVVVVLVVNVAGDILGAKIGGTTNGTFGIGLATALSYVAGFLVLLIHFFNKKSSFRFSLRYLNFSSFKDLLITGGPNGAKVTFIFGRNMIVNNIILAVGSPVAMIAFSAQAHISPFMESITAGLIAACLMLSSIFYGEEDTDSLNQLIRTLFRWVFTYMLACAIIYFITAPYLAILYGIGEGPARDQSIWAMRADAVCIPFVALNAPFLAIFQGTKRTKFAYVDTCLQSFVLPVLFLCIFGLTMRTDESIWIGIVSGFICCTFIHLFAAWIYARKISFDVRVLFFLPKNFGYQENEQMRLVITNIDDALNVTYPILDFCKAHHVDNRRMNHLAACAEELAIMTVFSGFTRDRKKHVCEMRVLYKNDDLTLRLRDDCAEFNIKEKAERIKKGEDPTQNVAIRIIMGLSKKVEYTNLLKTNNLIIKV